MLPLFELYPGLQEKLPYVSLGEFPTPVDRLKNMEILLGVGRFYIKRDDISGRIYGGNKVRKLEFLLGEALKNGAREVMTFGYAGSNHALATAICAKKAGLRSISMLMTQPNAHYVRKNLLMSRYYGAELHNYAGMGAMKRGAVFQKFLHWFRQGKLPEVIPPGGSSPTGVTGFVNAALELKRQIDGGELPEPDLIYAAAGTMGTVVGLMLGCAVAGMKSRVIAVPVVDYSFANYENICEYYYKARDFLHSLDKAFPSPECTVREEEVRKGYLGEQYALFTPQGMKAVSMMRDNEGIVLEGTYTGKTMAALIDDAKEGALSDKTVLFWNTHNSRDFSDVISGVDYHSLPRVFHHYFEEDVQPLDKQ